jgi:ribosome biogenesis protein BRX1
LSFTLADGRIWFRHYQMIEKKKNETNESHSNEELSLVEIGPRFVMNLVRILDGSFSGSTLYENPTFVTPNTSRKLVKMEKQSAYKARQKAVEDRKEKSIMNTLPKDPLADVFA